MLFIFFCGSLCFSKVLYTSLVVSAISGTKTPMKFRWDLPGRILVVGRQVGLPEDLPKDEQFDEAEGHQKAVHLLQGHRDSFLYFMRFQPCFFNETTWGGSRFFFSKNDMSRHLGGKCVKMVESLES